MILESVVALGLFELLKLCRGQRPSAGHRADLLVQ